MVPGTKWSGPQEKACVIMVVWRKEMISWGVCVLCKVGKG